MNTFVAEFFNSFDSKWDEVYKLLSMAESLTSKELSEDNIKTRNTFCKAAILLSVANFEAFLNDTIRYMLKDINFNKYFSKTSYQMRRIFCSAYISLENSNGKNIEKLIRTFDALNPEYEEASFFYENNKNPKTAVIEKLYGEIDGKNTFFGFLHDSSLEKIFEDEKAFIENTIEDMKKLLFSGTQTFPYKIEIDKVGFNPKPNKRVSRGIWEASLEEILKARHGIAHRGELDKEYPPSEIKKMIYKIKILELSFALLVCKECILEE